MSKNNTPQSKTVTAIRRPQHNSMRYVFREIIWPRRGLLFLGLILIVINRLSGLALPGASKLLIDDVIAKGDLVMMRWLLIAVTAAVAIQAVTSFALTRLLSVEAHHLIAQLRLNLQKHILQLPVAFFDNQKSGALVARIMSDAEGVRNLVGTGFVQLLGGILTALVAFIILLNINVTLTFVALVPMVLFGLISLKAFSFIRPIFRERSVINADVTGRLTETLGGIRVIKGFNAEQQESRIFAGGVDRLFSNVKKSLTSTSLVTSAATLLMGLASAAIMGIGGYYIIQNQMTIGDLFAFTLYLGFMIAPIIQMGNIGSQITEAFAGLDRMDELLKTERETDDAGRSVSLEHIKGDVEFRDVHFEYEPGKPILHGISFKAPAGSVTALVGSSGSGKTTISGLVASFLKPQQGMITVDGHDLNRLSLSGFRSHLGVVLQDDFLFEGTIRENILFARPGAGEEELRAAVEAAWVAEFADRFDEGLETVIGERGVKLSGGQRQRVAIARAILADPRILILDEATSSLDTESEKYIQQSLQKLMQGRTTFVIAHRLSTIRQADQILVIEKGRIAERGTHDQLIAREGRYFQLYTYQARI